MSAFNKIQEKVGPKSKPSVEGLLVELKQEKPVGIWNYRVGPAASRDKWLGWAQWHDQRSHHNTLANFF